MRATVGLDTVEALSKKPFQVSRPPSFKRPVEGFAAEVPSIADKAPKPIP